MRWRNFNEWKAYTITYLLNLQPKSEAMRLDITALLNRLNDARSRDLGRVLLKLHEFSLKYNIDLREILPTPKEVDQFFSQE